MSIFSNKSFMNRYFTAPTSTGPAKSGGPAKPIEPVKKASTLKKKGLSSEAGGEMINSRFVGDDPTGEPLTTEVKPKGEKKKLKNIILKNFEILIYPMEIQHKNHQKFFQHILIGQDISFHV